VIFGEPLLADEHAQRPLPGVVSMGGGDHGTGSEPVGQEPVDASESAVSVRVGVGSDDAAGSLALRVVITGETS
jgi:hypothetical protein